MPISAKNRSFAAMSMAFKGVSKERVGQVMTVVFTTRGWTSALEISRLVYPPGVYGMFPISLAWKPPLGT